MTTKGANHHVMPEGGGWCVVDDSNHRVRRYFENWEGAIVYARDCAHQSEGEVLVHATPSEGDHLSTVSLPQQTTLPHPGMIGEQGEKQPGEKAAGRTATEKKASMQDANRNPSDYDPLLGYDEYYFDI